MALGRNFTEALQKAMRSLEQKGASFSFTKQQLNAEELDALIEKTKIPTPKRSISSPRSVSRMRTWGLPMNVSLQK